MQKREKRKKKVSPTTLVMKELRKRGFPCEVVEKYIKAPFLHGGGFRRDLYGADVICLSKDHTILVQAGVTGDHAGKVRHALSLPEVAVWLSSEHRRFLVWTWSKRLVGKSGRWVARLSAIIPTDLGLESVPFQLT